MPKRKQPAQLNLRDTAGNLLSRRKRWFSHGVERQAANEKALAVEEQRALSRGANHDWEERMFAYDVQDEHEEYKVDNARHDRYLDELVSSLQKFTTGGRLLSIAPTALREQWLSRHSDAEGQVDRMLLEAKIDAPWDLSLPLKPQILTCVTPLSGFSLISEICRRAHCPACSQIILRYAPLWIRRPDTFQGHSLRDLLDHLFVKFVVPECLYAAWFPVQNPYLPNYKWVTWFLCFAQGGSLYKLGERADGWSVAKKFQHHFSEVRNGTPFTLGTMYAELNRLGVAAPVHVYMTGHHAYSMDITTSWTHIDAAYAKHWRETAMWLNKYVEEIAEGQAAILLDWASESFAMDRTFSWAGRTLNASFRHAHEILQKRLDRVARWQPIGMDWVGDDGWAIVELNTAEELEHEGDVLRHCVGGYGHVCGYGLSAIFSLRHNGVPIVTIELDPSNGLLKQVRGEMNRACSDLEMAQIQSWLASKITF